MFMAFMAIVIIASAPLLGGRLSRLSQMEIKYSGVLVAALVVQILITEVIRSGPHALLVALHLISYVMAAFVLWRNRRLPGLLVIGAGAMSNAVVIALNAGTLPASARALRNAGFVQDKAAFENSGTLAHPILPWLGDIVATPSWLPFRNVVSIGDMLILIGTAILMHAATRSVPWQILERYVRRLRPTSEAVACGRHRASDQDALRPAQAR